MVPGGALPSIRSLASQSGVSPGTVSLAYRVLKERGIIATSRGRRARITERPAIPSRLNPPLPPNVRDLRTSSPDPALLPDVGSFLTPDLYRPQLYDAPSVEPSLAEVMEEEFRRDGIHGPLSAVNGALDGLERILATLLRPGDTVLVEDPLWTASLSLLRVMGLNLLPVPVDDQGMRPAQLRGALASRSCAAAVLTPRAQNPYGSALSAPRAAELREILDEQPDLIVIEDDHASYIAGAPPATVTMGRRHWAVIRSMSKALGPDLRVAVMASDPETADRVQGRLTLGPGWVSYLAQRLVATILVDPDTREKIAHAEQTYTRRRRTFVDALASHGIHSVGHSGLNVLVPVPEEAELAGYLLSQGWAVRSGESFRLASNPFLRVTVSTLEKDEAQDLAGAFAVGMRPSGYRVAT